MFLANLVLRSPIEFPISCVFRAMITRLAAFHERRRRTVALQSLMFAPENRLRDLGITRDQLVMAIEVRRK